MGREIEPQAVQPVFRQQRRQPVEKAGVPRAANPRHALHHLRPDERHILVAPYDDHRPRRGLAETLDDIRPTQPSHCTRITGKSARGSITPADQCRQQGGGGPDSHVKLDLHILRAQHRQHFCLRTGQWIEKTIAERLRRKPGQLLRAALADKNPAHSFFA